MKTYKNLYPQVISFEALYQAYRLARRGKRERQVAADFEFNLESRLNGLFFGVPRRKVNETRIARYIHRTGNRFLKLV
jgi:hypothetical protein